MAGYVRWTPGLDGTLVALSFAHTYADISNIMGISQGALSFRLRRMGLEADRNQPLPKKPHVPRGTYTHNKDFFSEPNERNAMWAGVIASDGCIEIKKDGGHRVTMKLQKRDKQLLEALAAAVGYTGPVRITGQDQADLVISGAKKWVEDLSRNYNIVPRKSLILDPPVGLAHDLEYMFIIGFINGNGHIRRRRDGCFVIEIDSTYSNLVWIKNRLDMIDQPYKEYNGIYKKTKQEGWRLAIVGKRAERIFDNLSAIKVPYVFERKWDPQMVGR